ncbi:MAG: hypothetical protein BWY54_00620 [Candidatus Dependentiae bacterium ADurb.Bin331]|nr:MAG: hypothetical protein BWY54_00620 [Candidatus Dependentiae bacterium ADurb.Bin331]
MQRKFFKSFFLVCFSFSINAVELTITQPGFHSLGNNLTVLPTGADTVINIASSDVIFDLNDYFISQGNATANVNCFVINSNLTDVTIQNGTVRSFSGRGVVVNTLCTRININNMRFETCGVGGIAFNGAVGQAITLSDIRDCQFYNCSNGVTPGNLIDITSCNQININNIIIADTAALATISMINLSSAVLCQLNNIEIVNSTNAVQFVAIADTSGVENKYSNINIRGNSSGSGNFIGMSMLNLNASTFSNIAIIANTSSAGSLTGLNLSNADNCRYISSIVEGNVGTTGFTGFSFLNNGNQNIATDCSVVSNSVTGLNAIATGFNLDNGNREVLKQCVASNNSSPSGSAIGMSVQGSGGSSNCIIIDCMFNRNFGVNAVTSIGVVVVAPSASNLFTRTVAFNNNILAAAQLSGVPAGSVETPASPETSNINSIISPWSNLALAT